MNCLVQEADQICILPHPANAQLRICWHSLLISRYTLHLPWPYKLLPQWIYNFRRLTRLENSAVFLHKKDCWHYSCYRWASATKYLPASWDHIKSMGRGVSSRDCRPSCWLATSHTCSSLKVVLTPCISWWCIIFHSILMLLISRCTGFQLRKPIFSRLQFHVNSWSMCLLESSWSTIVRQFLKASSWRKQYHGQALLSLNGREQIFKS